MSYYLCKCCLYRTDRFCDIKRHFSYIKPCERAMSSYIKYSMDEIFILSLFLHNSNDKLEIDNDIIETVIKKKNYKFIYVNRKILLNKFNDKNMKKTKTCGYCNKVFENYSLLKQHLIIDCFYNYIKNKIRENDSDNEDFLEENDEYIGNEKVYYSKILTNNTNNTNNNTTNNNTITNNTTIQNQQNIETQNNTIVNVNNSTNITINFDLPVSFYESWDLSKLDEVGKKLEILCNDYIYTQLLTKILENDKNKNVILDKQKGYGFIYKNDSEKYVNMPIGDILDNSMKKLYDNLVTINNDVSCNTGFRFFGSNNKTRIDQKYSDYKTKEKIYTDVNGYISDIFELNRDKSIDICNKIVDGKLGY